MSTWEHVRDAQMHLFRECLEDCQLTDLGFTGPKFTWNNKQVGEDNVRVRLDRVVANGQFLEIFDQSHVENIITTSSDHFAVLLSLAKYNERQGNHARSQNFRYEAVWNRDPDYMETVERLWLDGFAGPKNLQTTWENLNKLAGSLHMWSKKTFGSIRSEIKKLERRLVQLRSASTTRTYSQEEKDIERRLCKLFEREEIMARQRSRVDWLHEGDRNTSFFHARASARRRTNKIKYLLKPDGSKCEDQHEMENMARCFYMNLFSTEPQRASSVLETIRTYIDQQTNDFLCKPCSDEEIKNALFQMGPTKAPGPDGFPALFYQRHWNLLHDEICTAIRSFLAGEEIPDGLCDTTIVLIPKVSRPEHLTNFRPISL